MFGFYGGFANIGTHIHVMHGLGIIMVLIFMHVFFAPYRRLRHAVIVEDFPDGANRLNQIRKLVGWNILIGLATVTAATAGRFLS